MNFKSIFKLADKVEGCFVELGFGKGRTADSILNLMKEGEIKRRKGFLFDKFTEVPIQPAFDRENVLPGIDIKVIKGDIRDTLPNAVTEKIAIAHIDLGDKESTKIALENIHPILTENGIIAFSINNNLVNEAIDEYFTTNKLEYQKKYTSDKQLYLLNKTAPIFFKNKKASKDSEPTPDLRVPKRVETVLEPFEDRYEKKIIPKFTPVKEIKKGLKVIGKKVTR